MSKIYNKYENDLDKSWYESSNIFYSECDDVTDGLKILRITFKNGRTYEYSDVNVNDYLLFREGDSQGKLFNKLIKHYPTKRLDDKNIDELQSELDKLLSIEEESSQYQLKFGKDTLAIKYNNHQIGDISLQEDIKCIIEKLLQTLKIKYKVYE